MDVTSPLRTELQLANMPDLGVTPLPLKSHLGNHRYELRGDELLESDGIGEPADPACRHDLLPGALDRFIKINGGKQALKFAEQYALLGLCAHGLPACHALSYPDIVPVYRPPGARPEEFAFDRIGNISCEPRLGVMKDGANGAVEYVNEWLGYVSHARALLSIAASLHRNLIPPRDLFDVDDVTWKPNLDEGWRYLSVEVNELLRLAGPRIVMGDLKTRRPRIEVSTSIFGVISVQLAAAVSRAQPMELCDGCGASYLRIGRAAQAGRRNFCGDCRGSVANTVRQRNYRSRRKEASNGEEG